MATMATAPTTHENGPARMEAASGQWFLLSGVSWEFYENVLTELRDRPVRVTFDRGSLEFTSPSYRHESGGRVLGMLLDVAAEEFDIPVKGARSTTFRRKDLDRGLEPDDCFYIRNLDRILGKTELDLSVDPPPDLAIEVDITRSSRNRMGIYAALGVPEVWRWQAGRVWVYVLDENAEYQEQAGSPTFPRLPLDRLADFVQQSVDTDDTTLRRTFRTWLRAEVLTKSAG